jgi:hypothetical protein
MILHTHLHRVHSQMKSLAAQYKVTKQCGQLKHEHTAVQTSFSPIHNGSDFLQMAGCDINIAQVNTKIGSDKTYSIKLKFVLYRNLMSL